MMNRYPLLETQMGVLAECLRYPESTQYNIPSITKLSDSVALDQVENAIYTIYKGRKELQLKISMDEEGNPWQYVSQDEGFVVRRLKMEEGKVTEYAKGEFVRPYDLLGGDILFRAVLIETERTHYLLLDYHHIIMDGISSTLLFTKRDMSRAYRGEELEEDPFGMIGYALAEQEKKNSSAYKRDKEYYTSRFEGVSLVSLSSGNSHRVGKLLRESEYVDVKKIDDWCNDRKISVDGLFQAAFSHVLSAAIREDRVAYTITSHGRFDRKIRNSYGMYVQTLPVLVEEKSDMTVSELIVSCTDEKIRAIRHHAYPFTALCRKLHMEPGISFNFLAMESSDETFDFGVTSCKVEQIDPEKAISDMAVSIYRSHGNYEIRITASEKLYEAELLRSFAKAMKTVIHKMLVSADEKICNISIVSDQEARELLEISQGEKRPVGDDTLVSMLRNRAKKTPDHPALSFKDRKYTYGEVDEITDHLASFLIRQHGVKSGDLVGVFIARSENMLLYPMAIMKTGAAYFPIDTKLPKERINYMCADSGAKLVLADSREKFIQASGCECSILEADDLENAKKEPVCGDLLEYAPKSGDLVNILYTSGSTCLPKAVRIVHRGIVNFCQYHAGEIKITEDDRVSVYSNFAFDAHMLDLYPTILAGAESYILSDEIRNDLDVLNDYYVKNRITVSFLTTQLACAFKGYKNSLRALVTGGEKLPELTAPEMDFYNAYGPTECSIYVTGHKVEGRFDGKTIGSPLPNVSLFVVDHHLNLLPAGMEGELLIGGICVAEGYHNQPELTREKFFEFEVPAAGEKIPVYRTGDVVKWNKKEGTLQFIGRIDNQVKLRGLRIELSGIESRALSYPGIEQAVALIKNERIVLYYTTAPAEAVVDETELDDYLGETLAEYMVPSIYMKLEKMELTTSGKVNTKLFPEPLLDTVKMVDADSDTEEGLLFLAMSQLKGIKFGVTDNMLSLGMSSIDVMKYAALIKRKFHIKLSVSDIMKAPTVRKIAKLIQRGSDRNSDSGDEVNANEKQSYYPVTENQRGVYVDWELKRDTTQYNVPAVYVFENADIEKLTDAIRTAVNAHSYLKTKFAYRDGDIRQIRDDEEYVTIQYEELDFSPEGEFFQNKVRPFDIMRDGLYRIEIYQYDHTAYVFVDIHHIIYDGLSAGILTGDILSVYNGGTIAGEKVTAYDFALFEERYREGEDYKRDREFFAELLGDGETMVYPDSEIPDGIPVNTIRARVNASAINAFCKKNGITVGSFACAAFSLTMQRALRTEHGVFATVSNGRSADASLFDCVGMFVRTLPVSLVELKDGSYGTKRYVKAVQNETRDIMAHEMYPYTKIVEEQGVHAEILFVYQGGIYEGGELEGIRQIPLAPDTAKFAITVLVYPEDDGLVTAIEYDGNRYNKKDMEALSKAICNVLHSLAEEEDIRNVKLVNREEEESIIELSTGDTLDFDTSVTWLDEFRSMVQKFPDKAAVVDAKSSITYQDLDKKSNALAAFLLEHDVKQDNFVAVKMDRCKEFIIAVTAIHKCGAAYVPIDLGYPEERIDFMQNDAEAKLVLTEELVCKALEEYAGSESKEVCLAAPERLAYMIYTSGSTGTPKGAMLHHKGLLNFTKVTVKQNELTSEDRIGHHFSFSFDSHIEDLYPVLVTGATIYLMPEEIRREPALIRKFLCDNEITGAGFTTAIGQILVNHYDIKLRYAAIMGEALTGVVCHDTNIINKYGPTECTNIIALHELEKDRVYRRIPIGRPMVNGYIFIVDQYGNLVPQGMTGEICYAGPQVGKGYWKLDDRTREVFEACPFVKDTPMYHTGDLGRYNSEGVLECLGRIDNQIKLRGYRVELGEIESRALTFEGIYMAVAMVKQERIILYYTKESQNTIVDEKKLEAYLGEALADFMMPSIFVHMEKMPQTPSGKILKRELPEPKRDSQRVVTEPENDMEIMIASCMAQVLGSRERIDPLDNFLAIGGDSIKAIRLISALREKNIESSVADIMKYKTVRNIAKAALEKRSAALISQEPVTGAVPDSAIVSFFRMLDLPEKSHFNQAVLLRTKGKVDEKAFQKAFDALSYQHDMLRAVVKDAALYIRGIENCIAVEQYSLDGISGITELCDRIQSNIHMDEALIRVAHIRAGEEEYVFLAAHHLIIDGVSWRILISDLEKAYSQAVRGDEITLPWKTGSYPDYASAMRAYRNTTTLKREIGYWNQVSNRLKNTEVSYNRDFSRVFKTKRASLDQNRTRAFVLAKKEKLNLDTNDILITALARSIARLKDCKEVSIQLEGHGREGFWEGLVIDRTIGWFTSIYPVVIDELNGNELQKDLLHVKETLHRVPNKGIGYHVLRMIDGDEAAEYSFDEIAMAGCNYLGEIDGESGDDSFFAIDDQIDTGLSVSTANCYGPDLDLNSHIVNGCFQLAVAYNSKKYLDSDIDDLIESYFDEMEAIVRYLDTEKQKILTAVDYGEMEWSEEEFNQVIREFEGRGEKISRIYPLTSMQEAMLLKYVSEPESAAYKLVYVFQYDRVPSKERIEEALVLLAQKYEVLRTAIVYEEVEKPRQVITDRRLSYRYVDLSQSESPFEEIKKIRRTAFDEEFDLQKKPLFHLTVAKKDENSSYLMIAVHHIIVDGWSLGNYLTDLVMCLNDGTLAVEDMSLDGMYERYVRAIQAFDKSDGIRYFTDLLSGYETKAEIPSFGEVPEGKRSSNDEFYLKIEAEVTQKLNEICKKERATINNAAELAWGMVLAAYSNTSDVVFAKVVSGRDKTGMELGALTGLFINSIPVRVRFDEEHTVRQMLRLLAEQAASSNEYDYIDLAAIQEATGLGKKLFQTVIAFENYNSGTRNSTSGVSPVIVREEQFDEINVSFFLTEAGELCLHITYDTARYYEEEIRRVMKLFRNYVHCIVEMPDVSYHTFPHLEKEDEKAVLALSAGEKMAYDENETWIDVFQKSVQDYPDHIAVSDAAGSLTYQELDRQSDLAAVYLMEQGVLDQDFVALKMTRVKEFVVALIGVHKAGAAYIPVDADYPEDRIQYMLTDSGARMVLTEEDIKSIVSENQCKPYERRDSKEKNAYMIYTSGSTGRPKGVIQKHRALRNFTEWRVKELDLKCDGRYAQFTSFSFDASLDDLLSPLCAGATVCIADEKVRMDITEMEKFIEENKINGFSITTKVGMELINYNPKLDLDYIMLGGERLLPTRETGFKIVNGYGPTEFTVCSSFHVIDGNETVIPIGRPVPNTCSFIADAYGNLLPQGVAGEICLAGPQAAEGYWKQPELTKEKFTELSVCGKVYRVYRTGDLGRYNEEGELEYYGRMDSQVKVRGFRIEPGEIEHQAVLHPFVDQAAAVVKNDQIVLYYTVLKDTELAVDELRTHMAEKLSDYMMPAVFMELDALPKNANGKLAKELLPEPVMADVEMVMPENALEHQLLHLAKEILTGIDFGVTDNLISLGLSSISMMRYAASVKVRMGVHVDIASIMKTPTIRAIAMSIEEAGSGDGTGEIPHFEKRKYYPVTENQRGIYVDWEMNKDTTQYNVPSAYFLGEVDTELVADAVKSAIRVHGYLETGFAYIDGDLMQVRNDDREPEVTIETLENEPDTAYLQGKVRPFDILNGRLYRIDVISCKNKVWLFVDVHHIIYDGMSSGIFIRDILSVIGGKELEERELTAYDMALFESGYYGSAGYRKDKEYFDVMLNGAAKAEYSESYHPDGVPYAVAKSRIKQTDIKKFCMENRVTVGSYMQAAFRETLRRVCRGDSLVYAAISNGRSKDIGLLNTVGMFVRTLPMVIGELEDGISTVEYVRKVHEEMQTTLQHEMYPYTRIVQDHGIYADILFVFQGGLYEGGEVEGIEQIALQTDAVKFAISVTIYPDEDDYVISIEYDGMKYSKGDMEALASAIGNAAWNMSKAGMVKDAFLVGENEIDALVDACTGENLDYDRNETWVDMFLRAAGTYADHTAVVDQNSSFTYEELDDYSNRIARYLLEHQVEENSFVAVQMDRVKEFVAAVLGIHKAGAAYVPVDTSYPEERIQYMLEDSGVKVVLTEEVVHDIVQNGERTGAVNRASKDDVAYMIYTSGSTGQPKGAMVPHRALLNFAHFIIRRLHMGPESRIACHTSFSFDVTVENLYPVLCTGGSTIIVPEEVRKDVDLLYDFFKEYQVTGTHITTQMGQLLGSQYKLDLEYIRLSGESMTSIPNCTGAVYNAYGPTECTVDVTDWKYEETFHERKIPIGKPMAGCMVLVMDEYHHLVPLGMAGELYLLGEQVGYGYYNKPEMTEEKFIDLTIQGKQYRAYRSGDLGRYLEDGQIEYLGRMDHQVKFRGYRIELGEIEARALQYAEVEQAVAIVKSEQLILYYTVKEEDGGDIAENLKMFLAKTLTDYMIPTIYMRLDKMPLTPNGKVNRKALPEPKMVSEEEYVEPVTLEEKMVSKCMRQVLGTEDEIGALDSFFALGGDSIKAIRLVSALRESGLKVQVSDIMNHKTVRKIAEDAKTNKKQFVIHQAPIEGQIADSAIVAFFKDLDLPKKEHFNQAILLRCREHLNIKDFEKALAAVTVQHDMLRAVYVDGHLYVNGADRNIDIEEYAVEGESGITGICNQINGSIDMETALFRAAILHAGDEDYLFLAAHHLIMDGVSWRIITADLESAYRAAMEGRKIVLPPKTSSYRDYVEALLAYRNSYRLELEISYWDKVEEKLLQMRTSRMKDYGRSFGSIEFTMNEADTKKIMHANKECFHLEINDILLTAVIKAYAEVFQEEEVSIQLEGHGREDISEKLLTDRTVGWFTSIYPVVVEGIKKNPDSLADDLMNVKEVLHRAPDKGVGYNVLRYLDGENQVEYSKESIAELGFNYLGEMDAGQDGESMFTAVHSIDTGIKMAKCNCYTPDIDINSVVAGKRFTLECAYNEGEYSSEEIALLVDRIRELLLAIADFLNSWEEKMVSPTDLGETEWSNDEFKAVIGEFQDRGENISRIYPLIPMQENMLYHHISDPDSWAYRLVSIFEMKGVPDDEVIREALVRLGRKYEVLRTAIVYEGVSVPRQVITDRVLPYEIRDISGTQDPCKAVHEIRKELLRSAFDLQKKPLFRLVSAKKNEGEAYLVIAVHHIIVDGWSMQNYLADLFRFIREQMREPGKIEDGKESLDGIYEAYVRNLMLLDKREGLRYWKDYLKNYETKAMIPSYGEIPEAERSQEDELTISIGAELTGKLTELVREERITLSLVLELAWGMVLSTYSNQSDVVFVKVVSGRDKSDMDLEKMTGLFINSVPVRVSLDKDVTVRELLKNLQEQAAVSNQYDYCSLADIQKQSVLGAELFQTVFAYENYNSGGEGAEEETLDDLRITPVNTKEENFDEINVSAYLDSHKELCLHIAFNTLLYRKSEIERVMELFRFMMEQIAGQPDAVVSRLKRLNKEDTKKVLQMSTGEQLQYNKEETFVDLFKKMVKEFPDRTAVVDHAGSFTYRELDVESDKVAAYLIEKGIQTGAFAAIKMRRRKEFMAAVLGVHKAGAAYVPVDMEYPEERIEYMLEDSEAEVVLTDGMVEEILAKEKGKDVNLAKPDLVAYMLYTSGTTGKPKGAMVSHRALCAFAHWNVRMLGITKDSKNVEQPGFSFDASLYDLICPLTAGAQVHIIDEDLRKNLVDLSDYIDEQGITGMTTSTKFGMELINYNPDMKMSYLMMGGEKLLPCEKTDVRLINGYGPTEFTVCSSFYDVVGGEENIPIGKPVPNSATYILDEYGSLVPKGVVGELCLAGVQLAEGYWKQPELTDEKFRYVDIAGESIRVYRTGDLGRYNEDDQLEYLGRTDNQVKLRGYRIELGEIENAAVKHRSIGQTVAMVKNDRLVLYYTLNDKVEKNVTPIERDRIEKNLQEFLAETLAEYMVPNLFVFVPVMPSTPNGKVDIEALPEPKFIQVEEYVAPATRCEEIVAEAMQNVLGLKEKVGAIDGFYALGGDSIKAIRLISVLRRKNLPVQLSDITKLQTVRKIAECAESRSNTVSISQEPIEGMVKDSAIVRFFKDLELPQPQYFTQSMLYKAVELLDTEKFTSAINAVYYQHDMLRAVQREGGLWVQSADTVLVPEIFEVSSREGITEVCRSIQESMDMSRALFRVAIIHDKMEKEEADYVFLAAHHLIIDGVSWRILSDDLETAYRELLHGAEPALEDKTSTYREYAEAIEAYRDSDILEKEIPYWNKVQNMLRTMPCSSGKDYSRTFGSAAASMEKADTESFLKADRDNMGLEINDILLAAVGRAYHKIFGRKEISVQLEGHGREKLADDLITDRTIGWFTSVFPVVFCVSGDRKQDLIEVKEAVHRIPNKGVGYNILRFFEGQKQVSYDTDMIPKIGFNYFGEIAGDTEEEKIFQIVNDLDTGEVGVDSNCFGADINMNCLVANGRFEISVTYNAEEYQKAEMNILLETIFAELKEIAGFLESSSEKIMTATDYGEWQWSTEEYDRIVKDYADRGESISELNELSTMQADAVQHGNKETSDLFRWGYAGLYQINAVPEKKQMEVVLKRLGNEYKGLRTAIIHEGVEVPRKAIINRKLQCERMDYSGLAHPDEEVLALRSSSLRETVDIQRESLLQVSVVQTGEERSAIMVKIHKYAVEDCDLSESLIAIKMLALLASEMRMNFRITDMVNPELLGECFRGDKRIGGCQKPYEDGKPVMVFPFGIILQKSIQHLIDDWCSRFNVVTFDTLNFHYKELFEGESYDDIANLYVTLLELMVPKDAEVFGCIGFSFAGELAFSIGEKTAKVRGKKPVVFLGDTDIIPMQAPDSAREATMDDFDDFTLENMKKHEIPQEAMLFAYGMLSHLNASSKTLDEYDGITVLLNAIKDSTEERRKTKIFLAKRVAKDLRIVNFQERDHFSLHISEDMIPIYNDLFDQYMLEMKH